MKKIFIKLTIIIILFLSFNIIKALDEREVLESVVSTSNVGSLLVYGGNIEVPTFNITTGNQAYFDTNEGGWYIYENNKWFRVANDYRFNGGAWHYRTQVRIDGTEYRLSYQTSITVDGEEWSFSYCNTCSGEDYSVGWVTSPSYNLEATGELEFFEKEAFHIYPSYIDTSINSFSVSSGVEGGTSPYTFSKVSGPNWINVSTDGTISGTPTVVASNDDLVVRVTDSEDAHKDITIKVDKTILPPSLREEITSVAATSNITTIPVLDENIISPTFNVTTPDGPFFANYNCGWYKKIGSNWVLQSSGEFTPGLWQYRAEVILEGEPAESYRLSDNTVVTVDGNVWESSLSGIANEYYAVSVKSPEYVVKSTISSIKLMGTINEPKIGDDIIEPVIGIESLNDDPYLVNYADVIAKWQYKTGEGFFDWEDASGKFEQGKTYHVRMMITINSDIYDLANIATFPVIFKSYELTQFQFNSKTVGEFIEFSPLNDVITPNINIVSDNNKVTLSWDNQSVATKTIIYRSNNAKKYSKISEVTTNSYVDKNLTYNKTYYYKVKVCSTTKCTNYSNVVSKKIKPNKVENFKISSAGTNNIKTAWDKVNVTGYQLQRSTNNKKWSTVKTITKNSTLSYDNKKLNSNKIYYYRVRAYKKVGRKKIYGPWSVVVSTRTAPVKPTIKLDIYDSETISVDIKSSKGATYYLGNTDYLKTFDSESLSNFWRSEPGIMYETGTTGKTLYVRFKACNEENRCSSYTTVSLKFTPKTPSLSLKTSSKKVSTIVGKIDDVDGYEIYRSTSKRGKYSLIKSLTNLDELIYENSTKKGKTYYYKVRCYKVVNNEKIYSSYSSIKSIRSK